MKQWCKHIKLVNGLTWMYEENDSYGNVAYIPVLWTWIYCPICSAKRPVKEPNE